MEGEAAGWRTPEVPEPGGRVLALPRARGGRRRHSGYHPAVGDLEQLPGHVTTEAELTSLGFAPLTLRTRGAITLFDGTGCEWDTLGTVPSGPGHYLFTVEDDSSMHVTYAGLTEELWMVTKGRLPDGRSRPAQRYGRPKYAGLTRQRINLLVTEQLAFGRCVRHWVRPLIQPTPQTPAATKVHLRVGEEELILRWRLREIGWNRG